MGRGFRPDFGLLFVFAGFGFQIRVWLTPVLFRFSRYFSYSKRQPRRSRAAIEPTWPFSLLTLDRFLSRPPLVVA